MQSIGMTTNSAIVDKVRISRQRSRALLITGLAVTAFAITACSASPVPADQTLTLSYVQAGEPVVAPIVVSGISCKKAGVGVIFENANGDVRFNAVVGSLNGHKSHTIGIKISDHLQFLSVEDFSSTNSRVTFDSTVGSIGEFDGAKLISVVDSNATLTGSLRCDS